MTSERYYILNLKKKFLNTEGGENVTVNAKSDAMQGVNERMQEIRMTASLNRLTVFKKAV